MELIHELVESVPGMAQCSYELTECYVKRYNLEQLAGAVVFTNLRTKEDVLKRKLSNARSTRERLCCIINAFQDSMLTLRALMISALDETETTEAAILKSIGDLLGYMAKVLRVIAQVKAKLNDTEIPESKGIQAIQDELTRYVMDHLHESSANELVYAVKNYAITAEVYTWSDDFVRHLNSLSTDV